MYQPRPSADTYNARRRRVVFDYALKSRLDELARYPDAALIVCCNDQQTADSLDHLRIAYPTLAIHTAIINPQPYAPPHPDAQTPFQCQWDDPSGWVQYWTTDRWARIKFALEISAQIAQNGNTTGYLIMPAHDAVWRTGLLDVLTAFSAQHARDGLPAAVSPYTSMHHSPIPSIAIPEICIDAINLAFFQHVDSFKSPDYQQFWGKMSLLPFGMCANVLERVEMRVWEDDLEIDTALRRLGYPTRARHSDDVYRQALPAFNFADVAAIFNRTIHYSLPIPPGNTSILARPFAEMWSRQPDYALKYWYRAACIEALVARCQREIDARLARYGCSWVDWGAYRHVVRVGDPFVQVWKYAPIFV